MTVKRNNNKGLQSGQTRTPAHNSVLPQLAVTCKIEAECSYQTFVQGSRSVILLNICAKNPPLRQAGQTLAVRQRRHTKTSNYTTK